MDAMIFSYNHSNNNLNNKISNYHYNNKFLKTLKKYSKSNLLIKIK